MLLVQIEKSPNLVEKLEGAPEMKSGACGRGVSGARMPEMFQTSTQVLLSLTRKSLLKIEQIIISGGLGGEKGTKYMQKSSGHLYAI